MNPTAVLSRLRDAVDFVTTAAMILVGSLYLAPFVYFDNDDPTWAQTAVAMVGAMLLMATVYAIAVGLGAV